MNDETLSRISGWIANARSAVALTGAGISTESGIPDFRSPGGVWSKYRTVYFDEFLASEDARTEYWKQKCEMHPEFASAEPNAGHRVLASWEEEGRLRGVVTQNIDGLHQMAGSRRVLELHGTARQAACLDCAAEFDIDPLVELFLSTGRAPECPECGGRLKHATVSFGQQLPSDVLQQAVEWCEKAEIVLAIGSSLVVTPAANLPAIAHQAGARLVIINQTTTPLDDVADIVIHESIGRTLTALQQHLSN